MNQYSDASDPRWFAVSTKSRQERTAASTLESLGISHFLPLIEQERSWSDRKKVITAPLFPGYLFVHIAKTAECQLQVRKVPGVADFVKNQEGPMAVAEHELDNVRALLSRGTFVTPHAYLAEGDRVRVVRGPLTGVEGTYMRAGGKSRIVISVELIQQAVAVEVQESDIESLPLDDAPRAPSPCA